MAALTEADEVSGHVHVLLHEVVLFRHSEDVSCGNIVRVKNFVLTS